MPLPILLKLGAGAAALFLVSGRKKPVAAPTSMPIPERMARVLATNDPNAIRFEAGRLKQEGHPAEAAQLEQAAATLDKEIAAGKKPAPVYPAVAPPAATPGPLSQPSAGPLPAGMVTSPGMPQPAGYPGITHPGAVIPAQPAPGVVLPLPVLGPGEALHYLPPPAPYDPRVQAWQTKLLSLGISVGPTGADGKFGASTRDATRTFQQRANAEAAKTGQVLLLVNGILDAATLARAALVFALPAPGSPATVPVLRPPPAPLPTVVQTTPTGPAVAVPPHVAVVPPSAPLPLPVLAPGQVLSRTNPGQTYSAQTLLWQNKLVSLGIMKPVDAIGKYGPTTETATRSFQTQANKYLASQKKPAISVDGKVGAQTLALAALAHPPNAGGALWGLVGGPLPASPLPGVIPAMMPGPIDPRIELAARVYDNLLRTGTGSEDRQLVHLFQAQQGLRASGFYQPSTALALARLGIVPPSPRYWPSTGRAKAKRNYQRELLKFAASDPQRREEWELAAR